jgi:DNA-binding transcriptional MerR regulator
VYRPAEACRIAEVAPYVLRYWETEFPALSEGKDKGTAKLYTARDVKIIARIRELLYDEGFTVAGAKKRLEAELSEGRFDDGLAPAPPVAEQRRADVAEQRRPEKPAAAPRRVEPAPPPRKTASPAPAAMPAPAPAPRAAAPSRTETVTKSASAGTTAVPDFDRRTVLRELKDIVRLLDRARK